MSRSRIPTLLTAYHHAQPATILLTHLSSSCLVKISVKYLACIVSCLYIYICVQNSRRFRSSCSVRVLLFRFRLPPNHLRRPSHHVIRSSANHESLVSPCFTRSLATRYYHVRDKNPHYQTTMWRCLESTQTTRCCGEQKSTDITYLLRKMVIACLACFVSISGVHVQVLQTLIFQTQMVGGIIVSSKSHNNCTVSPPLLQDKAT
jgi:hypothetical protein